MSYGDVMFAREYRLDTERLKKRAARNKRIQNFNNTLGTVFNLAAMATGQPWLAAGGSVVKWLNPEKKYKTAYFRNDEAAALNRERRNNIPQWYDPLMDVGIAYLSSEASSKLGDLFKKPFVGEIAGGPKVQLSKDVASSLPMEVQKVPSGKDIFRSGFSKGFTQGGGLTQSSGHPLMQKTFSDLGFAKLPGVRSALAAGTESIPSFNLKLSPAELRTAAWNENYINSVLPESIDAAREQLGAATKLGKKSGVSAGFLQTMYDSYVDEYDKLIKLWQP